MSLSPQRSLTARIYLFAIACAALFLIVQVAVAKLVFEPSFRRQVGRIESALAISIEAVGDDPAALQATVDAQAHRTGRGMVLIAADGTILAAAGGPLAEMSAAETAQVQPGELRWIRDSVLAIPVAGPGRLADATLLVEGPEEPLSVQQMIAILAALLALLFLLSAVFGRGLVLPMRRLSSAAGAFGAGELTARARLTRRDELGEVGRRFDEMADRVTAVLDANRALMGAVSHELRTPMSRIRVALDLAAEDPAAGQELLAGVGEDLAELERMIDDILTMTRLDAADGVARLRTETVAPEELGARAAARWRQRHGNRQLELDITDGLPAIEADPALLRRVVDNLLDNAARHAATAAPVVLRIDRLGDRVRFAVVDRGPGMTSDEVRQAFTPFWRSDASRTRDTGGVGLGLALARQVARAHDGDVTIESAPGRGTTAVMSIPIPQKQSETVQT